MGNSSSNFKNGVGSVDISLDFEIDPKRGQQELAKFGYYFNKKGQCRSIKTDERVGKFPSQHEYEEFGAALERFVFFLLRDQYNMTEHELGNSNAGNKQRKEFGNIDSSKIAKSRIYTSPNYGESETLLLLIPGSGAVRAGQWARSICINDDLAAGCMYPFIAESYKRKWGVILFDPNGRTDGGRIFSDEHVVHVYNKFIEGPFLSKKDCNIQNVLIVCHSAGGMATSRLLNNKVKYLLPRIRGVAGTDTFFGSAKNKKISKIYEKYIVNWVTSDRPLGTVLSTGTPKRLSAGHNEHAYTSAAAFKHIFNFFDSQIKLYNMNNNKHQKKNDKEIEIETKEENGKNKNDKNDKTDKTDKTDKIDNDEKGPSDDTNEQCKETEKNDKLDVNNVDKQNDKTDKDEQNIDQQTENHDDKQKNKQNNDKMEIDD